MEPRRWEPALRGAPTFTDKKILQWGGVNPSYKQEWLLSLILVYAEKLQTGRVESELKYISGPNR